jgi:hypothetical protein
MGEGIAAPCHNRRVTAIVANFFGSLPELIANI